MFTMIQKLARIKPAIVATVAGVALLFANMAVADEISLTHESGAIGDTVVVTLDYTADGMDQVLQADIEISDPDSFSNIDVTGICSGAVATSVSCVLNADGDRILLSVVKGTAEGPLDDFSGTAEFTIDASANEGDVINLAFVPANDGTFTPLETTDGSITIEAAADDGSELAVTPSSHDFGTIDEGDSDSTTFTAENVGDSDLDITGVSIDGDSQFSIANDGCNGQTLTPGDTCEVDVDFNGDAAGTYSAEITFESDADVNDEVVVEVTGEVVEDNGAEEGFTVDFDGGLGVGDAGDTVSSTGTVDYVGDTSGSLSCSLSGDPVFSSNPDPLDFTFPESDSADFTIYCDLPEDAEDGQDYGGALSCTDENDEVVYSGELSCSVTTDEPEPTPAVPVPTMQSWGIALFSLIMLAIGGLSIRAFRS